MPPSVVSELNRISVVSPLGAEPYGKGDIWVLWRTESRVSTASEVLAAAHTAHGSLKEPTTHPAAHTQSFLEQCRQSFTTLRSESGYPLPWLKGALWQVKLRVELYELQHLLELV